MLLCNTQKNGYKLGFETLKLSNFSPRMGFRMSFDTQNLVNYWFLEPNNMSVTLDLLCISREKGIKWFLNTQNCVKKQNTIVYYTQRNGYKLGSETLTPSNFSQRMGFTLNFDFKNWVNYWFLEPNNVSVIKTL